MAYIDSNLEFSDAQAITATALSEDVYDTQSVAAGGGSIGITGGATTYDLGQSGKGMFLIVHALTAGGGTGTIIITLESDSTANLATAPTVHFTAATVTASAITAGQRIAAVGLPLGLYKRYLGLRFTCSGTPSGVTFDAYLSLEPSGIYRAYPGNFVVL